MCGYVNNLMFALFVKYVLYWMYVIMLYEYLLIIIQLIYYHIIINIELNYSQSIIIWYLRGYGMYTYFYLLNYIF